MVKKKAKYHKPQTTNHKLVIIISGLPGAGTTTVAKAVAKRFKLRYFSAGKIFRKIAKERGIKFPVFNETAEMEVDLQVDNESRKSAAKGGVVIEGKIGAWINSDAKNLIKILLTAPLQSRAKRVFNDRKKRVAEKYKSIDETADKLQRRYEADQRRYMKYYNINISDTSIFDLIIGTENLTKEQVINKVAEYIRRRLKGK